MALYGSIDSGFIPAFAARVQFSPDDPAYQQTRKTAVCDAQGNFNFTDLPAGKYFLIAAVMWTIPGQEYMPQGGALLKSVALANGKSERVILTH
ncbi:MAG: hypothetical protein CVV14_01355 [Gammaproteobacteria bacterium HGW-Gammaproteobacteria-4]|jgi:hypothetical protein|nr:MAG: hypothetical protein CVV16_13450 [Gammaproteobacteria bacterium HGW-Gammaproteobacteria-6]PKM08981.1 MAG: hypothetical protein CVV14_01355 [Gammaproteobacteria bacterium HGW-Gammaproteobacteria-4]